MGAWYAEAVSVRRPRVTPRIRSWLTASLALAVVCLLVGASGASADIEPPWCGTHEPDAAENLPDGTEEGDPPGSFPHIPYYAIGCTLESIRSRSDGRMSLKVIGRSARGREMYLVTINGLRTRAQRDSYERLQQILREASTDPEEAQELVERRDAKVPIFIQSGIHGNEYEGVDAAMRAIERLATTPYGEDPEVDALLDHAVVAFNVVQNPDGRIAGTRFNGNGFDLNRDYITQSQSETVASVEVFRRWLPTEALDLHGYVEPTLLEATTVPHNPGIEYDLWLKWSQPRLDANQAALGGEGFGITRPVNNIPPEWIPEGETLPQGWDDWGPFYTGQYGQLRGLDTSTVEACNEIDAECGIDGVPPQLLGRAGAMRTLELSVWSTFDFVVENRREMMLDQLEIYRRGVEDEPRVELTDPLPVVGSAAEHDYMTDYPRAHVIPLDDGQRSDAEAKRLVDFLLANDIEVSRLKRDYRFGGEEFEKGSYVVWLDQALRGLANTMLSVGDDISDRVTQLYAPPGAWSNGFLWGADVVTIPRDRRFQPSTSPIDRASSVSGGVRSDRADWYALPVDSPTAVRAINSLVGAGVQARLATEPFESRSGERLPAGSAIFSSDAEKRLRAVGRSAGLWFEAIRGDLPAREPIERVPRIACLCSALENWALEQLGFSADQWTNSTINSAPSDPLANYDVIYNTSQGYPADTPANSTVRARYQAFFAGGGGYVGARTNGANFLVSSGAAQLRGLDAESQGERSDSGKATEQVDELLETFGRVTPAFQFDVSGIVFWDNEQRASSPIVGAYPARDTGLVETPVWFTDVPPDVTVDGRLPASDYLASGHWPNPDPSAGGSAIIVHGPNTQNTARITLFGIDPLFRAHPERSFPAVSAGFYWGDI
jgi:Zinc carboxypeptidase